jgi:hypothetical protein
MGTDLKTLSKVRKLIMPEGALFMDVAWFGVIILVAMIWIVLDV